MTANLDDIAKKIAEAIAPLSLAPSERKDLIAKIAAVSAGGEMTSIGTGAGTASHITTLSAATAEAARVKLTPLQAANAGANSGHVRNVMSRAARLGYRMKENEKIDLVELDRVLAGKDTLERIALKTDMSRLRLI
jgi:hypothetical protein